MTEVILMEVTKWLNSKVCESVLIICDKLLTTNWQLCEWALKRGVDCYFLLNDCEMQICIL
jgi:hypothetical protein